LVVSICIPTFNSETWIKDTLENIENISYDKNNLELMFVDGKSIDGTVDILENFKEKNLHKYQEIKIIVQPCNIPEARNICIKESSGEYLLFVDSDIMLSRNSVQLLTNHMKNTSIASIYYQRCRPDPPKKTVENVEYVGMGCTMMRRHVFQEVGMFNPSFQRGEDVEFCLRAKQNNLTIILDSTIVLEHKIREITEGYGLDCLIIAVNKSSKKTSLLLSVLGTLPTRARSRFILNLFNIILALLNPLFLFPTIHQIGVQYIRRREFFTALIINHYRYFKCHVCTQSGRPLRDYQVHVCATYMPKLPYHNSIRNVHFFQLPVNITCLNFRTMKELRFELFMYMVKCISSDKIGQNSKVIEPYVMS
jgi:glycosyltransferase involved in cell wall biosynthesis